MKNAPAIVSIASAALFFSLSASAHPLSKEECSEGSDFIKNAALSRENGMDGMTFMAKTIADLETIRSFPAELRWFAQDRQDEDYLLKAIAEVFEKPQDPQAHQRQFFGQCLVRTTSSQ